MSSDNDRFDGLYLNVAQQIQGIEPLLDSVFSFLRRKTDFFSGPDGQGSEMAIAKVNQVVQKHADIYNKEKNTPKAKPKKKAVKPDDNLVEMDSDGQYDVSSAPQQQQQQQQEAPPPANKEKPATAAPKETKPAAASADESLKEAKDDDEKRGPAPVGNGGTVDGKYVWTQTLSELLVTIPVPPNTRGRDLNVLISKQHIKVALLRSSSDTTSSSIMDAKLTKQIIMEDSFWTVEDGSRLVVNLQKVSQMEWWDSVCEGDPKINVRDIQPENSSLSDLDGDTRKTVEKMLFDQRQKALGLPTSDEEKKLATLEKFKQQHPEMDFSNAKIS